MAIKKFKKQHVVLSHRLKKKELNICNHIWSRSLLFSCKLSVSTKLKTF